MMRLFMAIKSDLHRRITYPGGLENKLPNVKKSKSPGFFDPENVNIYDLSLSHILKYHSTLGCPAFSSILKTTQKSKSFISF